MQLAPTRQDPGLGKRSGPGLLQPLGLEEAEAQRRIKSGSESRASKEEVSSTQISLLLFFLWSCVALTFLFPALTTYLPFAKARQCSTARAVGIKEA